MDRSDGEREGRTKSNAALVSTMQIKWQRKPMSADPFMPIVMAAFPCLPFQKGEGYPSNTQKTLSLSFMLRCSPLNRQKDGLEGEKKEREESMS